MSLEDTNIDLQSNLPMSQWVQAKPFFYEYATGSRKSSLCSAEYTPKEYVINTIRSVFPTFTPYLLISYNIMTKVHEMLVPPPTHCPKADIVSCHNMVSWKFPTI